MSKATILKNKGEGLYEIALDINTPILQKLKDRIQADEIRAQADIDALQPQYDVAVQTTAEKKIAFDTAIQDLHTAQDKVKADYQALLDSIASQESVIESNKSDMDTKGYNLDAAKNTLRDLNANLNYIKSLPPPDNIPPQTLLDAIASQEVAVTDAEALYLTAKSTYTNSVHSLSDLESKKKNFRLKPEQKIIDAVTEAEEKWSEAKTSERDSLFALNNAKLELKAIETNRDKIINTPVSKTIDAWVMDYSIDYTPDTPPIEAITIAGELSSIPVLIKPGFENQSKFDNGGQLVDVSLMSPEQFWFCVAALPAHEKWKPSYRRATILAIHDDGTVDIELEETYSSQNYAAVKKLEITPPGTRFCNRVPVKYMATNIGAFEIGDRVIIEFINRDKKTPRVIGFVDHPRPDSIYFESGFYEVRNYSPYGLDTYLPARLVYGQSPSIQGRIKVQPGGLTGENLPERDSRVLGWGEKSKKDPNGNESPIPIYCTDTRLPDKKKAVALVHSSLFTGKLAWYVQAIMGTHKGYDRYTLSGEGIASNISVSNIKNNPFDLCWNSAQNGMWLYSGIEPFTYWIIHVVSGQIKATRLLPSPLGKSFIKRLIPLALSGAALKQAELVVLSTCYPEDTSEIIGSARFSGDPLYYGWHSTLGGGVARCVLVESKPDKYSSREASISISYADGVLSAALTLGVETDWDISPQETTIWIPDTFGMAALAPKGQVYTWGIKPCDSPVYGWYDENETWVTVNIKQTGNSALVARTSGFDGGICTPISIDPNLGYGANDTYPGTEIFWEPDPPPYMYTWDQENMRYDQTFSDPQTSVCGYSFNPWTQGKIKQTANIQGEIVNEWWTTSGNYGSSFILIPHGAVDGGVLFGAKDWNYKTGYNKKIQSFKSNATFKRMAVYERVNCLDDSAGYQWNEYGTVKYHVYHWEPGYDNCPYPEAVFLYSGSDYYTINATVKWGHGNNPTVDEAHIEQSSGTVIDFDDYFRPNLVTFPYLPVTSVVKISKNGSYVYVFSRGERGSHDWPANGDAAIGDS